MNVKKLPEDFKYLPEEFEENDSEIETNARDSISGAGVNGRFYCPKHIPKNCHTLKVDH